MPLGGCSVFCTDVGLEQVDKEICPEIFGMLCFGGFFFFYFGFLFGFFLLFSLRTYFFRKGCEAEERQLLGWNN